jgi:hypothetical protein
VSGGYWEGHGPHPSGPQEGAAASNLPPRAPSAQSRPWAASGYGPNWLFCYFLYRNIVLIDFVQFLGKFHTVFTTQIIPMKICLENSKVTETFLQSLKFMNFIHVSAANS